MCMCHRHREVPLWQGWERQDALTKPLKRDRAPRYATQTHRWGCSSSFLCKGESYPQRVGTLLRGGHRPLARQVLGLWRVWHLTGTKEGGCKACLGHFRYREHLQHLLCVAKLTVKSCSSTSSRTRSMPILFSRWHKHS